MTDARLTRSRRSLAQWLHFTNPISAWIGIGLISAVVAIAIFGPFFSPYSPSELAGIPFMDPTGEFLLGTDFLGRDVLSRVLWGGRAVIVLALLATVMGYVVGALIGLIAGYAGGLTDGILMRAMDLLLAFPPILFLLILATGAGASPIVLVFGIATMHVPQVARVIRAATLEISVRAYVEAAVVRGERMLAVLAREILPNITKPLAADAGPRLTVSILLVAALNFLGIGLRPPAADWASMISENRAGLAIQPWAVVVPAVLIALLTIATNLLADTISRRLGTSVDPRLLAR